MCPIFVPLFDPLLELWNCVISWDVWLLFVLKLNSKFSKKAVFKIMLTESSVLVASARVLHPWSLNHDRIRSRAYEKSWRPRIDEQLLCLEPIELLHVIERKMEEKMDVSVCYSRTGSSSSVSSLPCAVWPPSRRFSCLDTWLPTWPTRAAAGEVQKQRHAHLKTPTPAAAHLFPFSAHHRLSSFHQRNSLSPFHLLPIPLTHSRAIFLHVVRALL
jgi:hypothetical protein